MLEIKEQKTVLDKGFIGLIDVLGSDQRIVDCARVSYQKGTKHNSSNKDLIDYLIRSKHTSPLEQVEFVFVIKAPIFIIIQLLRHRTANVNSESGRFSVLNNEFYIPKKSRLKKQSKINKQGSDEQIDDLSSEIIQNYFKNNCIEQSEDYNELIEKYDLSKEIARINLPLSTYMNLVWKCDLHNIFNFLKLRMAKDAQEEIRDYANAMYELIKPYVPLSCNSFEEHILNSKSFSYSELKVIKNIIETNLKNGLNLREIAENKGLKGTRLKQFLELFGVEK